MGAEDAHRETDRRAKATLYVVATPIGNLADVTQRALDVLRSADVVAAEDTRITARLLDRYGIHRRLLALHEHNEQRMAGTIIEMLESGSSVALVSDAGTPAISDPGARLVAAVRAAGHAVSPVPGPNAAVAALSASGMEAPHFLFYGFLPARRAERTQAIEALAVLPHALVFYEAPHRVVECAADLHAALGERTIFIARELTKRFETLHTCPLSQASAWLAGDAARTKGEFVLVVSGAPARKATDEAEARRVLEILLAELPLKQAVGLAARLTHARRNELYELALALKGAEDGNGR
jgi:16S rRNA (cytidine1402-2'-O)-methyltransferase